MCIPAILPSYSPCFSRDCVHFQNGLPPKPLWCSRHFYRLGCYPLVNQHEPSALEVAQLWHKFVAVLHQVHSLFKTSHPNFLYSCDEWIGKKSTAGGPASVCGLSTVGSLFGLTRIASPEVQRLELIFKERLWYQAYRTLPVLYRYTTQNWVKSYGFP